MKNTKNMKKIKTKNTNAKRQLFFSKRVKELGLLDEKSDYDAIIGKSILKLSDAVAKQQGHSSASLATTCFLFYSLMVEWQLKKHHKEHDEKYKRTIATAMWWLNTNKAKAKAKAVQ